MYKESAFAKSSGRPNLLSDELPQKTKDIVIGTSIAGTVTARRMVIATEAGLSVFFFSHLLELLFQEAAYMKPRLNLIPG